MKSVRELPASARGAGPIAMRPCRAGEAFGHLLEAGSAQEGPWLAPRAILGRQASFK